MPRPSKLGKASAANNDGRLFSANAGPATHQARPSRRKAVAAPSAEKPVALTLKVDQPGYEALKVSAAARIRVNPARLRCRFRSVLGASAPVLMARLTPPEPAAVVG